MKPITPDMHFGYLNVKLDSRIHAAKHIPNMKMFCVKMYITIKTKLLSMIKR